MKFFTRNTKEKVEPLPQDLYAVIDPRGNVIMSVNDTLSSLHWNAPGTKIGVYHLMFVRDLQINEPTLKEPETIPSI